MKANELRIGNKIIGVYSDGENDELEDICTVLALDETGEINGHKIWVESSNSNAEIFSEFKPIPLTEEWLIRFGFDNLGKFGWGIGDFHIENTKNLRGKYKYKYCFRTISRKIIRVTTVHQLQNMFYILTGKELRTK